MAVQGTLPDAGHPSCIFSGVHDETFASPEEAAVSDFPTKYVRVEEVSYSDNGNTALVTVITNEEPYLYPYYVHCAREASGRWSETGGHN